VLHGANEHARALLTSSPEGKTTIWDADLQGVDAIVAGAAHTLDPSQPVAVLLISILHGLAARDSRASELVLSFLVTR
jgi:hypothetical protein